MATKIESIYELIERISQYETNPAQVPLKLVGELTTVFLGRKARGLAIQIGGEALVIKAVDEFEEKIALKVPRMDILRNAPRRNAAVLKNIVRFVKGDDEIENVNATRFSEGATLQRDLQKVATEEGVLHFKIPQVKRISTEPVLHYTMEWYDSPSLLRWLREKNDVLYSLSIFKKVLYACDFLHKRGIVHRDWKSENLLITEKDSVVILDWTMAKLLTTTRNLTIPGSLGGTAGFAPLKFVADRDFKHANYSDDLYLLGFVLWEFLAQKKLPGLAREHYTKQGIDAFRRKLIEDIPEAAQAVFWHATEQNECERFQTCKEFLDAIKRLESYFVQDSGFEPDSQTLTPTLVLPRTLCKNCGACGGVGFCEKLSEFIRRSLNE